MFEKYITNQISDFLYTKRKKAGLTQSNLAWIFIENSGIDSENLPGAENTRRNISGIENGEPVKGNRALLTRQMLDYYSTTFHISKDEILFGNNEQIEAFCKHIFLKCAYDRFDYKNKLVATHSEALKSINSKILDLMISNVEFANYYVELSYNNHFQGRKTTLKVIITDNHHLFEVITEKLWSLLKEYFIELFCEEFLGKYIASYELNPQILLWLEQKVLVELNVIHEAWKKDEILSLGYQVFDINTMLYNLRDGNVPKTGRYISSDIKSIDNEAFFNEKYKVYKNLSKKLTELQIRYLNI